MEDFDQALYICPRLTQYHWEDIVQPLLGKVHHFLLEMDLIHRGWTSVLREHNSKERISWLTSSTLCRRKTPYQSCLPSAVSLSQGVAWEGSVAGQILVLWQADQSSRVQLTRAKEATVSLTWQASLYTRASGLWDTHYQQHQQGYLLHGFLSTKPRTS